MRKHPPCPPQPEPCDPPIDRLNWKGILQGDSGESLGSPGLRRNPKTPQTYALPLWVRGLLLLLPGPPGSQRLRPRHGSPLLWVGLLSGPFSIPEKCMSSAQGAGVCEIFGRHTLNLLLRDGSPSLRLRKERLARQTRGFPLTKTSLPPTTDFSHPKPQVLSK